MAEHEPRRSFRRTGAGGARGRPGRRAAPDRGDRDGDSGTGRHSSFETLGSRVSEILGRPRPRRPRSPAGPTRRRRSTTSAEATVVTSRAEADHYASDVRERAEREALAITARATHRGGAHPRRRPGAARGPAARRHRGLRAAGRGAGRATHQAEAEFATRPPPTNSDWLALTAHVDVGHRGAVAGARDRPDGSSRDDRRGRRYRAKMRAQIRAAREQLQAVMSKRRHAHVTRQRGPDSTSGEIPRPSAEAPASETRRGRRTAPSPRDDPSPGPTRTPAMAAPWSPEPGRWRTCGTAACAAERSAGQPFRADWPEPTHPRADRRRTLLTPDP